jgi:hypothetical protein
MSDYSTLFSTANFVRTIEKYADDHDWSIASSNPSKVVMKFGMESGSTQTLYIIRHDSTLEFSVPSKFTFADEDDIPHRLSSILLAKNAEFKIGFWCIEKIQGEHTFSVMHNQEISLLDSAHFGRIVRKLISECDDFEEAIDKIE